MLRHPVISHIFSIVTIGSRNNMKATEFTINRSGRGGSALSFPASLSREWDPSTDDTRRLRVTLRFKDNADGIVLSDVRAGSVEEADGGGGGGGSYKKGSR